MASSSCASAHNVRCSAIGFGEPADGGVAPLRDAPGGRDAAAPIRRAHATAHRRRAPSDGGDRHSVAAARQVSREVPNRARIDHADGQR